MTCLPCAKEIINGLAAHKNKALHDIVSKIEPLVKEGRLSKYDANKLYDDAIAADKSYIADVDALEAAFVGMVAPPAWLAEKPEG